MVREQVKYFQQFKVDFIDVTSYFEGKEFFTSNRPDITVETYFRLLIPELFSDYKKVIYLDGDMICRIDVSEIYDIDLGINWIATTRDILGIGSYYRYGSNLGNQHRKYFDGLLALKDHNNYFLAGLIIFNICQWSLSTKELFDIALSRNWLVHDQDMLNVLCENKTLILPLEYQYTDFSQNDDYHYCIKFLPEHIKQEYFIAQKCPKIIHFNTFSRKPWNVSFYTPYFELFWGYAIRTPFLDTIILRMKNKNLIGKHPLSIKRIVKKLCPVIS
jgi:lipopolysaccharide biosynthesis glycosyltransferase